MIAYNKAWFDNIFYKEQLRQALAENLISRAESETVDASFAAGFYSPNIFIRIGLFILTAIVVSFSTGLMALLFLSGEDAAIRAVLIVIGLLCYLALEWIVANKKHFQSGVDDALMWSSGLLITVGVSWSGDLSAQANSFIIFLLALYFTIRFTDRAMALVSMLALLALVFFIGVKIGGMAKLILPFLLMILSAVFYFITTKLGTERRYRHYHPALFVVEIAALVCVYLAGNYYVVRKAGNSFLGLQLAEGQEIPFGWLFWIFTVAIPLFYILAGIKKKDIILVRTGTLLIAIMVLTIRFYYHVLPAEAALLLGGLLLVGVSYLLIKLLKESRGGFTSIEAAYSNNSGLQNIEAIIIAETLSTQQPFGDDTKFGGGSFGGGGASSDF